MFRASGLSTGRRGPHYGSFGACGPFKRHCRQACVPVKAFGTVIIILLHPVQNFADRTVRILQTVEYCAAEIIVKNLYFMERD